jgi:membrane-associated phospholipid phosphatase
MPPPRRSRLRAPLLAASLASALMAGVTRPALASGEAAAPSPANAAMARGIDRLWSAPAMPRLQGGWLFDDAVRASVVAPGRPAQRAAALVSDGLLLSLLAAPYASAALFAASDADVPAFAQLVMMNTGAFALGFAVTWALRATVGRERPFATAAGLSRWCADPAHRDARACNADRNASFLSGHAATAFTSAGLLCAQGAFLSRANGVGDGALCSAAMAMAATTAMLRVVADRHYATDTLAGMATGLGAGLAVGVAVPWAVAAVVRRGHREGAAQPRVLSRASRRPRLAPMFDGRSAGVGLLGMF